MPNFIAELIGTMVLIILGGGVVGGVVLTKSKAQNAGWIVITVGWGIAVAIAIYAVGKISGAHLNPAVTLGLASVGEFPWKDVPLYILGQLCGAFLGAVVVYLHYLPHWRKTQEGELKRAVFCTDPAIDAKWSNLMSEIIGTAFLMQGILAIGSNEFTQGLNPLVVGLLIVALGMSLGGTTGYAINPARDLGPRIAHFLLPIPGKTHSNWGYAWIPVVGPIMGGVFGSLLYYALFKQQATPAFWVGCVLMAGVMVMAVVEERKRNA